MLKKSDIAPALPQARQDAPLPGLRSHLKEILNVDTLRHLARANVSYLAPIGNGLELTGGLMKGFINYESFYAKDNFNYTRAYLTDLLSKCVLRPGSTADRHEILASLFRQHRPVAK
jgi:hypothetical protein